ncbi:unnamed protein product [Bemisia tabaci]|uniref:Cytochrome P450 n=1 Tax=Bemisia tabaci TaxID=7038 RepID=A0A9P0AA72_BEMTA|nr:unnamed protein product [Bemisia tabaci]
MLSWGRTVIEGLFGLLLCIPVYLVVKFSRLHKRWAKHGIVGHDTNLLVHAWFRRNHLSYSTIDTIYKRFINEKCVGLHQGLKPVLMAINTKLIGSIYENVGVKFSKITHNDNNRLRLVLERDEPCTEELEKGPVYKNEDAEIEPSVPSLLNGENSEVIYQTTFHCSNELRMSLEARAHENRIIDIVEEIERLKLDLIGVTFFGLSFGRIRQPKFRFKENVSKLSTPVSLMDRIMGAIGKDAGSARRNAEMLDYFVKLYYDCLNGPASTFSPRSSHKTFPALVHSDDLLSVPGSLTTEEIVNSIMLFIQEHMERIHSALTFALYEVSVNPEVQLNIIEEINRTMKHTDDDKIPLEHLHSMKYLDQVVLETLRKYPVSGLMSTKCTESYKTDQLEIEEGMDVLLPILSIHHDPHHYPRPDSFDPQRFAACSLNDVSQVPLMAQQIQDIGGNYGVAILKVTLALLVRDYRLQRCRQTPESPVSMNQQTSICLKPVSCIPVQISSRSPEKGFFPHIVNRSG